MPQFDTVNDVAAHAAFVPLQIVAPLSEADKPTAVVVPVLKPYSLASPLIPKYSLAVDHKYWLIHRRCYS